MVSLEIANSPKPVRLRFGCKVRKHLLSPPHNFHYLVRINLNKGDLKMSYFLKPIGYFWKLLVAVKSLLFVSLIIASLALNVAQFTGHAILP